MDSERVDMLQMLSERLERLNVDSKWSRRASGTRGSVIRTLSLLRDGEFVPVDTIDILIKKSLDILSRAAKEIPEHHEES